MSSSPGTSGSWGDFHLDENCVRITEENRTRLYLAQLGIACNSLERVVAAETSSRNAERWAVGDFVSLLSGMFRLLALKHYFATPGAELKIDTTDSGFFHFSTLLELAAEARRAAAELAGMPTARELKRQMLERIIEYSAHPGELQRAMVRRQYLEALHDRPPMKAFMRGPLIKVGRADDRRSWFWSFVTHDRALNRPFLYLMYVHHRGRGRLRDGSPPFEDMAKVAEQAASGRTNLLGFCHQFDAKLRDISPRIVKRIIVGPYWSPAFTKNEGELGELLADTADQLPWLLRWEAETLISDREKEVAEGSWLLRRQIRQVFWVPRTLDLATRGVSNLERFALMPYWLAQHVRERGLLSDHELHAVDEQERVHAVG